MMLFKARKSAREEVQKTLAEHGLTVDELRELAKLPWLRRTLHHAPHAHRGSTAANFVIEAARWKKRLAKLGAAPRKLLQLAASF
jgi:hypothetical protein